MFKNLTPQINKIIISLNNSRNYVLSSSSSGISNCGLNLKNNNNNYYHLQQSQTRYCNNQKLNNNNASKANKSSINNNMTSSATDDTNIGSSSSPTAAAMHTNRLINEKSPYLLQHAHNPVDWYPWGDEAIQRAKNENKLIFLSVGYSTCHWCHVMEKESFEDVETANILNTHFINIKVDREERPDIDKIFMQFTVALTGSGGWPMSVWLTSDIVPLTAGTYFPPKSRWGMPSFKTVLMKVNDHWKSFDASDHLKLKALQESLHSTTGTTGGTVGTDTDSDLEIEEKFYEATKIYTANFDKFWGGFKKSGPKFPEGSKLSFLLDAHIQQSDKQQQQQRQSQQRQVLPVLTETLVKIANGGIHDHVFGGFARYSVDERWHIPHFEKMLYDQGQLLSIYANTYKVTRNPLFLSIADKLIRYCLKDLKHPLGGFFSGEDADSYPTDGAADKIEGAFYAWTHSEIRECCEKNSTLFSIDLEDAIKMYCLYYDVQVKGNVLPSSDPHGHLTGKNVLMINTHTINDLSEQFKYPQEVITGAIDLINNELHKIRDERPRPHLDTKIITAWNGLLLSGISDVVNLEKDKKYLDVARSLMEFIKTHLYNSDTNTLLRACYGKAIGNDSISVLSSPVNGFLDDYAFLIRGLLDYYLVSLNVDVLNWARDLQTKQDELFWDDIDGGYYYSQENEQITRLKDDHDMAEPSGNSIAAFNLLLLGGYFEDKSYKDKAKRIYQLYNSQKPFGYIFPKMLSSMLLFDHGLTMIVVVGSPTDETNKLFDCIRQFYIPGLLLFHYDPKNTDTVILPTRPSIVQFKMVNDQTTVYLCQNKVCQLPITTYEQLYESLSMKYLFNN